MTQNKQAARELACALGVPDAVAARRLADPRRAGGAWQPLRGEDVTVFLQVGTDYIPVEATDRNMAGLAAIARLISPDVGDRLRQVLCLLQETRDARQAGQRVGR